MTVAEGRHYGEIMVDFSRLEDLPLHTPRAGVASISDSFLTCCCLFLLTCLLCPFLDGKVSSNQPWTLISTSKDLRGMKMKMTFSGCRVNSFKKRESLPLLSFIRRHHRRRGRESHILKKTPITDQRLRTTMMCR